MHSNGTWREVEAAFAPMVWDFPDAPADCVRRYRGVTVGMWRVGLEPLLTGWAPEWPRPCALPHAAMRR